MSKTVNYSGGSFSGSVTFACPLTYPQFFAWQDAISAAGKLNANGKPESGSSLDRWYYSALPGALACVESFDLTNFPGSVTVDTFPATPQPDSITLVSWLITQVSQVVRGVDEIPNA